MSQTERPSVVYVVVVAVVLACLGVYDAVRERSEPASIQRSEKLELEEVAPVITAMPELRWVVPEGEGPGWGSVEVPPTPADLGARLEQGNNLALDLCVVCHGTGGQGTGHLAYGTRRPPLNLTKTLRTRLSSGAVTPGEVYRTLTAGAPRYGMPSFAHVGEGDRWALVAWVLSLQPKGQPPSKPLELPPRPEGEPDLHLGQDVYRQSCAVCHGAEGEGNTPAGAVLRDLAGALSPPAVFAFGPAAFRAGARTEDIARVVAHGRPDTMMVDMKLKPEHLWAVSAYVAKLAELGLAKRRLSWNAHFAARKAVANLAKGAFAEEPQRRFSPRLSKRHARAPEGAPPGCLACHDGIEQISKGAMAEALLAVSGGDEARACVVCHEGDPTATVKLVAHEGLIANPGNLWVTSVGAGCAKCHSSRGSLTTLMGQPLPEPVGGRLMQARSTRTDPTGKSSGDYTYRVQRSLMAQETGKVLLVTSSVGFVEPEAPRFSNFPLVDADGPTPAVGSEGYRGWILAAIEKGYVQRLEKTLGVPTFEEATALGGGNRALASVVDYARKNCFRCHLWGEGKPSRAERRSAGCSACHMLTTDLALSDSEDKTIPRNARRFPGHTTTHELVMSPPSSQCNRCHTRNPFTHGNDPHERAQMGCGDCHSSIDVHGDGNAYPNMEQQVEVRCEDCHGSGTSKPWELTLGHDTPAPGSGPRGVYEQDGKSYLLTNRGNPRTNWLLEDGKVVIESFRTGVRHVTPILRPAPEKAEGTPGEGCSKAVPGHEQVACSLCHNRKAPRCGSCHMTYNPITPAQDWLLSALAFDPLTTRQQAVHTPGKVRFTDTTEKKPGQTLPFGAPDTRRDRANRLTPREPGCTVTAEVEDPMTGAVTPVFTPRFNPGTRSYPPVVANTLPHENSMPPRSCKECHPQGTGKGKPVVLFGHVQTGRGDFWRNKAARSRWADYDYGQKK